jgi:hypothetical protein
MFFSARIRCMPFSCMRSIIELYIFFFLDITSFVF